MLAFIHKFDLIHTHTHTHAAGNDPIRMQLWYERLWSTVTIRFARNSTMIAVLVLVTERTSRRNPWRQRTTWAHAVCSRFRYAAAGQRYARAHTMVNVGDATSSRNDGQTNVHTRTNTPRCLGGVAASPAHCWVCVCVYVHMCGGAI